jgi:cholesterol transport system auxiliary component
MIHSLRLLAVAVAAAVSMGGCALLTKSEPFTPRFFSVEPQSVPSARPPAEGSGRLELRLGRVTSAAYLGERIVYRKSPSELAFYEDRRWTEKPEAYLRRSLVRAFFDDASFSHVVSGAGPQLDVDLVEFAELKGPGHVARVRAAFALYEARYVRAGGTVTAEVPVTAAKSDAEAEAVVTAMSQALDAAVAQIVEQVRSHLLGRVAGRVAGEGDGRVEHAKGRVDDEAQLPSHPVGVGEP